MKIKTTAVMTEEIRCINTARFLQRRGIVGHFVVIVRIKKGGACREQEASLSDLFSGH